MGDPWVEEMLKRQRESKKESPEFHIIYNRQCDDCGHLFLEMVGWGSLVICEACCCVFETKDQDEQMKRYKELCEKRKSES